MKIYEAAIPLSSVEGSFALPPLPVEIADQYRVMRLHVKAEGCPMWWRRDGEDIDPNTSYRISTGSTYSVEVPEQIPLLRFAFDPESAQRAIEGEPTLRLVYEGLDSTAWLKDPRPLTLEEFTQPILNAQSGKEQMRTRNCVDVVTSSSPGAVIPQEPIKAPEMGDLERDAVEASQRQILSKAAACVDAVRQAMAGGRR